jgi:hypothetical protein
MRRDDDADFVRDYADNPSPATYTAADDEDDDADQDDVATALRRLELLRGKVRELAARLAKLEAASGARSRTRSAPRYGRAPTGVQHRVSINAIQSKGESA